MSDISKKQDGSIVKSVLRNGDEKSESPRDGSQCTVLMVTHMSDGSEIEKTITFILGEGSEHGICPPVERAIHRFKRGECCQVHVKPSSCGKSEFYSGLASLYTVTLIDFIQIPGHWEIDFMECLSLAQKFKNRGTDFFRVGKIHLAKKHYKRSLLYLQSNESANVKGELADGVTSINDCIASLQDESKHVGQGTEKDMINRINDSIKKNSANHVAMQNCHENCFEFREIACDNSGANGPQICGSTGLVMINLAEQRTKLIETVNLNLAQCYLNLGKNLSALDACDKALKINSKSVKGLYRRGLAHLAMENFELAVEDLMNAHYLDQDVDIINSQLNFAKHKLNEYRRTEKNIFAGMFSKFAICDTAKEREADRRRSDVFTDIGEWSNELAKDMMSLEQEMAAFGEEMPKPKYQECGDDNNEEQADSDYD